MIGQRNAKEPRDGTDRSNQSHRGEMPNWASGLSAELAQTTV